MKCAETGHVTQQGAQMTDNEPYIIESYVWMTRILFLPSFYTTKLRMYLCTDVFCVLQVFMKRVFSRYSFFFFNFLLHVPYASFISIIILFYSLLLVSYCFVFRWISLGSSPISPTCPGCRLSFIVSWIRDALWCSLIHGAALLIFFLFLLLSSYFYLFENGFSFILRFYSSFSSFFLEVLVFFSEVTLNLAYNRPSHLER